MVGNEESDRHICGLMPGVYCPPECWRLRPEGTCFSQRRHWPLEIKPRPDDGDTKDQASAQAAAEAGFHDQIGGGPLSYDRPAYPSPSEILFDRLVHWFQA
jgi:hypothetical protein